MPSIERGLEMVRWIFPFVILFSELSLAQAFSHGNSFQVIPLYGNLTVNCPVASGGSQRLEWQCQDERLTPAEHDYFLGPDVDADVVELNAVSPKTHAVTQKIANYRSGSSTTLFNLWVSSFLQAPLLDVGINKIFFSLKKDSKAVANGVFSVTVTRGKAVQCQAGVINSNDPADCNNPLTLCAQYFQELQYCQ